MIDKYTLEEIIKIEKIRKHLLLLELSDRFDKLIHEIESKQNLYEKIVKDILEINVLIFEELNNLYGIKFYNDKKHLLQPEFDYDSDTFSVLTIDEIQKCIELFNNFDIEKEDENNI